MHNCTFFLQDMERIYGSRYVSFPYKIIRRRQVRSSWGARQGQLSERLCYLYCCPIFHGAPPWFHWLCCKLLYAVETFHGASHGFIGCVASFSMLLKHFMERPNGFIGCVASCSMLLKHFMERPNGFISCVASCSICCCMVSLTALQVSLCC